MFIVYTGNRFNQILIFDSFNKAAEWLRKSTNYSELEIAKAIKTPRDSGNCYLTVSDK